MSYPPFYIPIEAWRAWHENTARREQEPRQEPEERSVAHGKLLSGEPILPHGPICPVCQEVNGACLRRWRTDCAWLWHYATRPSGHMRNPVASWLTTRDKPAEEAAHQRKNSQEHPLKKRVRGVLNAEPSCQPPEEVAHLIGIQQLARFLKHVVCSVQVLSLLPPLRNAPRRNTSQRRNNSTAIAHSLYTRYGSGVNPK